MFSTVTCTWKLLSLPSRDNSLANAVSELLPKNSSHTRSTVSWSERRACNWIDARRFSSLYTGDVMFAVCLETRLTDLTTLSNPFCLAFASLRLDEV